MTLSLSSLYLTIAFFCRVHCVLVASVPYQVGGAEDGSVAEGGLWTVDRTVVDEEPLAVDRTVVVGGLWTLDRTVVDEEPLAVDMVDEEPLAVDRTVVDGGLWTVDRTVVDEKPLAVDMVDEEPLAMDRTVVDEGLWTVDRTVVDGGLWTVDRTVVDKEPLTVDRTVVDEKPLAVDRTVVDGGGGSITDGGRAGRQTLFQWSDSVDCPPSTCRCRGRLNPKGEGNCNSLLHGKSWCYVDNNPCAVKSCPDLHRSRWRPEWYYSAFACRESLGEDVLQVAKVSDKAIIPTKGSDKSAGYDLYSAYNYTIPARGKVVAQTDLQVKVPQGTYGRVAPRSDLASENHIDIVGSVVDEDYRGNLAVVMFNHADVDFNLASGDRIAQLICEKIAYPKLMEVASLDRFP